MRKTLMGIFMAFLCCGGCDSPTDSTTYPTMTGEWEGTWTNSWIARIQPPEGGSATCDMTWVIDNQEQGSFRGTFMRPDSGDGACLDSGFVLGSVTVNGDIRVELAGLHQTPPPTQGSTEFSGVISTPGTVTARCTFSSVVHDEALGDVTIDAIRTITMVRK
jgi:hypothetical protein